MQLPHDVNKISKSFLCLPYHKENVKNIVLNSCWQILSCVLANSQIQLNATKHLLAKLSQEPITVSLISPLQLTKGLFQKVRHTFQMPKRDILALPFFCLYMVMEEHQLLPRHRWITWSVDWRVREVLVGSCSETVILCMTIINLSWGHWLCSCQSKIVLPSPWMSFMPKNSKQSSTTPNIIKTHYLHRLPITSLIKIQLCVLILRKVSGLALNDFVKYREVAESMLEASENREKQSIPETVGQVWFTV